MRLIRFLLVLVICISNNSNLLFVEGATPTADAEFEACTGGSSCGDENDFCGESPNFATCGEKDGLCYCTNKKKDYDGVTAAAFSSSDKCVEASANSPCQKKCSERPRVLTKELKSYICSVDDELRCFCDFRVKRGKFSKCNKDTDCNKNCKASPKCDKGVIAGVPIPTVCNCVEGGGLSEDGMAKCKDDSYCYNNCMAGTAATAGKACPLGGKTGCVCADE